MATSSSSSSSRTKLDESTAQNHDQGKEQDEKSTSAKQSDQNHDIEKQSPTPNGLPNGSPLQPAQTHDPEFEVSFDGLDDPMNPRGFSNSRKWLFVLICSSTSFCVTCTSSIFAMTYPQLEEEFGISNIVATLGVSLFVAGLGLSPMLLGPLSEFYGRKPIYIVSLSFFVLWIIPAGVAPNIQTLLIVRFLDGFAGSAFLTVSGGTVSDCFSGIDLQAPMLIFTASPFLGPIFGPIIGGFINSYANWRWTFWTLLIWSCVQLILVSTLVPETFHPVLLKKKAQKLRKETGDDRWHAPMEKTKKSKTKSVLTSCYRPFQLLALEPMCLNLCLYSALLLGILYLFFGAFNIVFTHNHGFSLWQVGLSFTGMGVGMLAAIASDPIWHKNYVRLVQQGEAQGKKNPEPEYRLPPAIAGAPLVTIGLFWFGWTTFTSVHWIVPIIGSAFFGAGIILVFSGIFTFLVAAYPAYAASALAANSFVRSSFAAAFPLFGPAMYNNLGYQWATTILAMLSVCMLPFPYIFFRYGSRIRQTSRFASSKES